MTETLVVALPPRAARAGVNFDELYRASRDDLYAYVVRRRANYATIDLNFEGRRDGAGGAAGWNPDDALGDARRILEVSVGVLLVVGAALIPLAALGIAAGLGARAVRRRREQILA